MRKSRSPAIGRLLAALLIGILLLMTSSEDAPLISIYDSLESGLSNNYGEYVYALNNAARGDRVAFENVLRTDGLQDGAAYEHGWVLLELLHFVGDAAYHDALVSLDEAALKRACEYIEAGCDMHTRTEVLRDQYPLTFQIVKTNGVLGALVIPSERNVVHQRVADNGH